MLKMIVTPKELNGILDNEDFEMIINKNKGVNTMINKVSFGQINNNSNASNTKWNVKGIVATGLITGTITSLFAKVKQNDKIIDTFNKTTGEAINKTPLKRNWFLALGLAVISAVAFAVSPSGKVKEK